MERTFLDGEEEPEVRVWEMTKIMGKPYDWRVAYFGHMNEKIIIHRGEEEVLQKSLSSLITFIHQNDSVADMTIHLTNVRNLGHGSLIAVP